VNGRTGGAVAVGRGLAAAWVMRLLLGARELFVHGHRTESWCLLASGPPSSRRPVARPG